MCCGEGPRCKTKDKESDAWCGVWSVSSVSGEEGKRERLSQTRLFILSGTQPSTRNYALDGKLGGHSHKPRLPLCTYTVTLPLVSGDGGERGL